VAVISGKMSGSVSKVGKMVKKKKLIGKGSKQKNS